MAGRPKKAFYDPQTGVVDTLSADMTRSDIIEVLQGLPYPKKQRADDYVWLLLEKEVRDWLVRRLSKQS